MSMLRALATTLLVLSVAAPALSAEDRAAKTGTEGRPEGGPEQLCREESPLHHRGAYLVFRAMGLVRMDGEETRKGARFLRATEGGGSQLHIPLEKAPELLRAPVPRAQAEAWLGLLLKTSTSAPPDERPLRIRYPEAMKTMVKGSDGDRVRLLQTLYASPFERAFTERKIVDKLEQSVVGEMAFVLGRPLDELLKELHQVHSAKGSFSPNPRKRRPEPPISRPPPPFELRGHQFLGTFSLQSGKAVVGDPIYLASDDDGACAGRDNLLIDALPGQWHAFAKISGNRVDELIAVHAKAAPRMRSLRESARELGLVWVDSGRVAMLDAAVRRLEAYEDAVRFSLEGTGLIEGRGCVGISGDGDGIFPVAAATEQGKAVLLNVVF